MARRTLCGPDVCAALFAALREGKDIVAACEAAGISRSSYYEWFGRGERGERSHDRYAVFRERAIEATAIGAKARLERDLAALNAC